MTQSVFRSVNRDHTVGVFRKKEHKNYAIAHYLKEDILQLLQREPPLDLFTWYNLPPGEYPEQAEYIVELMCDDISLLIRENMVATVHLFFSEIESLDGQFPMTFHALYFVLDPDRKVKATLGTQLIGERIAPPAEAIEGRRFTVLVDWIPGLTRSKALLARRPRQFFDWVPFDEQMDQENTDIWQTIAGQMGAPRSQPRRP